MGFMSQAYYYFDEKWEYYMFDCAEDYLLEYANDPKGNVWVSNVIKVFLAGKCDEYTEALAQDLIGVSVCAVSGLGVNKAIENTSTVVLKELTHISGVNALAGKQKIRFSNNVNVIYGLNGTGKSSYFRILNEMVGGKRETPILPNVYSDCPDPISVSLKYTVDGVPGEQAWDGATRAISLLSPVRVFDSVYTEAMLKKREADELVVKPYGLNVFEELNTFLTNIVSRAEEIIEDEEKNIPIIDWSMIRDEEKDQFSKDNFTDSDKQAIEQFFIDLNALGLEKKIKSGKEEISKLQEQNLDDKLKIQNAKLRVYSKLIERLEELQREASQKQANISSLIVEYKNCKDDSDNFRKQMDILSTIPGADTQEWKTFVAAGAKYAKKAELTAECPYCHRPYDETSLRVVQAYIDFISNDAEQQLKKKIVEIENARDEISQWNVDFELDEASIEKGLLGTIQKWKAKLKLLKKELLQSIDGKAYSVEALEKNDDLINQIKEQREICEGDVEILKSDSLQKASKLRECTETLEKLISENAVLNQKDDINQMIQIRNLIASQKMKLLDITKAKSGLSKLSNKAHQELLTEQLQSCFMDILKDLIKKPINVELKGKNSAGKQQTELVIQKTKSVTSILSEGEQKAAALALFLAEIKVSHNRSAIILDDPVNSLDHKIIDAFANQLMSLDNQLIVFTHNSLFLNSFESTSKGHVCKGIDSACGKTKGKHIYLYETQSEGISRKGIVTEKAMENADLFLRRAEEKLLQVPLTEAAPVCANIRQAIEEIIDEIVFNRLTPNKYSNKTDRIQWDALKKLNPDADLIDKLHEIHGRCSGGELHLGGEREDNPVDVEELQSMCSMLRAYVTRE